MIVVIMVFYYYDETAADFNATEGSLPLQNVTRCSRSYVSHSLTESLSLSIDLTDVTLVTIIIR